MRHFYHGEQLLTKIRATTHQPDMASAGTEGGLMRELALHMLFKLSEKCAQFVNASEHIFDYLVKSDVT